MQVYVQTRDGKRTLYKTGRFGTAGELKLRIGRALGVPMGFSRLVFRSKILANTVQLEDIGVRPLSTLELYWEPVICTQKRFRELELKGEMKELDTKSVHENMSESYDQMLKTGGRRGKGAKAAAFKAAPSVLDFVVPIRPVASRKMLLASQEVIENDVEEYSDLSDDELDLMAIFRRQKAEMKSLEESMQQLVDIDANGNTDFGLVPEESQDLNELKERQEYKEPVETGEE